MPVSYRNDASRRAEARIAEPYTDGYRDALKEQIDYHEGQARHYRRHYRSAWTIELAERRVALRIHEGEIERLRTLLEKLDRAEDPIPMPRPGESAEARR
jgi:hypothetical protein